jgi:hypothetical protein
VLRMSGGDPPAAIQHNPAAAFPYGPLNLSLRLTFAIIYITKREKDDSRRP